MTSITKRIATRTGSASRASRRYTSETGCLVSTSGVRRFNAGSTSARKHGRSASPAPATAAATNDALALLRDTTVAFPACSASHFAAGAAVESLLRATISCPDKIVRIDRSRPAREIGVGRIQRPTYFAERTPDEILVDDRPHHHRQISLASLEVGRPVGADDLERDLGVVTPQLRKGLRKKTREGLRHGQANPRALRCGGRARG